MNEHEHAGPNVVAVTISRERTGPPFSGAKRAGRDAPAAFGGRVRPSTTSATCT